jgi:hypothetical protein
MRLLVLTLLLRLLDINGVDRQPLHVAASDKANVLFFVTNDCPISNSFAHEIARICADYKTQGVACTLVYVDPSLTNPQVRQHAAEFGHGDYPKIIDLHHELVKATGVNTTPEAAVIDKTGSIVYRGRIDDSIAALGQPRRSVQHADLRNALTQLLAGQPIITPRTHALGCYISDLTR